MTKSQIIVTIVLGVVSNLITALMLTGLKWQLKRILRDDVSGAGARFQIWFYTHLESITLLGMAVDVALLGFILIRFPTVTLWTVLAMLFGVVVMALQLSVYVVAKVVRGIVDFIFRSMQGTDRFDANRTRTVP